MKKRNTLLLFLLLILLNSYAYSQVWVRNYNGPANGDDKSTAIQADAAGNIYITGYSTGIGSMKDITTLKFTPSGVQQWVQRYNGPVNGNDEAYAITVDGSGNVYVTGYSTGINSSRDIFIIKYNNLGVQLWTVRHSSSGNYSDEAYAITVDGSGNIYVCGHEYDNNFDNEIVVLKYNSSGAFQWRRDYNGTANNDNDEAYAITVDGTGNIYITGYSEGNSSERDFVTIKYNPAGVQQWVQRYNYSLKNENDEAYAITVDGSNVYVTGYSIGNNGKDYVTIKYNASGVQQWLSRYNNSSANSDDIARSLAVMNNGDIVVTGSSKSAASTDKEDYLTVRYNTSNGSEVFTARYNDSSSNSQDIAYSVKVTSSNSGIFVTGSSRQTALLGSEDIVTIEYTPTGGFQRKYRLDNEGQDAAKTIIVNDNKEFYVSGYLSKFPNSFDMTAAKFEGKKLDGISIIGTNVPLNYNLYQNFPNPFNPSTVIRFDIPDPNMVKISIYDVLGSEIAVPVNEFLRSGTYEASVALYNLPSGMYFYKMTSGTFSESKIMMLIK